MRKYSSVARRFFLNSGAQIVTGKLKYYFAQTATSAPALVSGLAPHETDKSER
jgi:hypothetical protein